MRKLSSGGYRCHDRHPSKRHVGVCYSPLGSRPLVWREPDGSGSVGGTTRVGRGDASRSAFMANLILPQVPDRTIGPNSWHLGAGRIYSIAVNGSGGNGKRCGGLLSCLSGRVLCTVLGAGVGVKRQWAKPVGLAGEVSCAGG